jgi:hypothetical protein
MRQIIRLIPVIFILSLVLSTHLYGQVDSDTGFVGFKAPKLAYKSSAIKIGTIPLLVGEIPYCGEIRITYEHSIASNQSLLLGVSYDFPSITLLIASMQMGSGIGGFSWRGGRVMLGYRWYPLKDAKAPQGFYAGPLLSGNFLNIKDKQNAATYETMDYLNASMVTGYQVLAHNGFTFDIFGGLGYRDNFISHDSGVGLPVPFILGSGFQHVKVTAQVNLGYSF